MNIYETMDFINGFSKSGAPVKNLNRFSDIMDMLGNPQDKISVIHIAGTNGKGSTARMISGALIRAGYKTGEFASPYIKTYNDRIRTGGKNIPDNDLCRLAEYIRPVFEAKGGECSQFELSCAMAFVYFYETRCDIAVIETGIGGLLDCTNIIKKPLISVITSISEDHTSVLGESLEQIARHKAGIIKNGSPIVLSGEQKKTVWQMVYKKAMLENSPFITPNYERLHAGECGYLGNNFTYKGMSYITKMPGKHQIDNALTAIETCGALKKMGLKLSYADIYDGIKNASLPSRCQVIKEKSPVIIIDGAHNPDGMRALADLIRTVPVTPKVMVCGISETKDWRTALGYITRYIDKAVCVDGFVPGTVFAPKLAGMFRDGETANLRSAIPRAVSYAGERGMVVVAGSLYLASALQKFM